MKIGFIADIHVDFNRRHDFIEVFKECVKEMQLEAIVFAGDTSNDYKEAILFYDRLKEALGIGIYAVVGNHDQYDLYAKRGGGEEVQRRARRNYEAITYHQEYSILLNPIVTEKWFVTGIGGWYDYTFAENYPDVNLTKLANKKSGGFRWLDKQYIDGDLNTLDLDLQKVEESLQELRKSLTDSQADGRKKCVVTHMLPTKLLARKKPSVFATSTAYLGSERYRHLYEELGVSLSISGHSHHRKVVLQNDITYVNVSLGYNFQWGNKLNALQEVKNTIYILGDD